MLKTKKILAFLIASGLVCASFTACGDDSDDTTDTAEVEETEVVEDEDDAEDAEDAEEEDSEDAEEEAPRQVETAEFEDAIVPEPGDAFLSMVDGQWWLMYTGSDTDILCYDAGVVPITGNGEYTVSVTCDTNAARYDGTGDASGDLVANGTAFMAVQIQDGEEVCPDAIISVTKIVVDGTEIPITRSSYTNTEDYNGSSNIRSNIFNEWVSDENLPEDARCADGYLTDIDDSSDYSATIIDTSLIGDWSTVEVTFEISGM